jgi:hypothetical protein
MAMTWCRWMTVMAVFAIAVGVAHPADAQLGSLLSPGRLTRPHTELEGMANCTECHERGRGVSATRCLSCHKPVADRIARRVGIHRNVTNDCVQCHVEHSGLDGELRPFNLATFDHARDANYPLDGEHAAVAAKCESCHTTRSFLTAKTTCVSCHEDVHKGDLGTACDTCHTTKTPFAAASKTFDHGTTRFALTGAHRSATCESCHKSPTFAGVAFASCASCHENPHTPALSGTCSSCHGTETWRTRRFDHSRTDFPLVGKHRTTECASCHKTSAFRDTPAATTCASCHTDPHRGEFAEDCASCHTEESLSGGTFDHDTRTPFALTEGHGSLTCVSCHTKVVMGVPTARVSADFRGLTGTCTSCHDDPHETTLGSACSTCHTTATFSMTAYSHERSPELFEGAHAPLTCEACHEPARIPRTGELALAAARFTATPTDCVACHRDVHLGQVGSDCAACHALTGEPFAADRFAHDRATFKLTGTHATTDCAGCHKEETAAFPAGTGTTVRYTGIDGACRTCHEDVHLGQLDRNCESCHDTVTFDMTTYTHRRRDAAFFAGPHLTAECAACHKPSERRFPSGTGRAIDFTTSKTCVSCHTDVHRGAMGRDCASCHRITR